MATKPRRKPEDVPGPWLVFVRRQDMPSIDENSSYPDHHLNLEIRDGMNWRAPGAAPDSPRRCGMGLSPRKEVMSNKKLAKRLLKTLRKHYGEHEDIDTMVIDALTDLRHLCDRHELDFAELDRMAMDHYQVEYEPIKEAKQ